eukprot:4728160-Pyramimonas_sp.AAC.2
MDINRYKPDTGGVVAHDEQAAGEQTHLRAHVKLLPAVRLDTAVVAVLQAPAALLAHLKGVVKALNIRTK